MDKKYTSLEHSIRNIMTETVGVTGKDKPEGTPRSFLKPVGVISPPKGEEHPGTKKTATILAQRGEDKVQHALRKEEVLDEGQAALKLPTPDPTVEMPKFDDSSKQYKKTPKLQPPANVNKKVQSSILQNLLKKFPVGKVAGPLAAFWAGLGVQPAGEGSDKPEGKPATAADLERLAKERAPKKETEPAGPPKPAPIVEPQTTPAREEPAYKPKPAARPEVPGAFPAAKPVPATSPAPATTPAADPLQAPVLAPVTSKAAAPGISNQPAAQQQTQQQTKRKRKKEEEEQQNKKRQRLSFNIPGVTSQPTGGIQGATPTDPWSAHRASEYAPNRFSESKDSAESADSQRTSIEYVARPKGLTRFGRQAEIKLKIIDENMKKVDTIKKVIADKKNSTVILKPKLKDPDMDENK